FDRMQIWGKLGARVLQFPYVQPPLSLASSPDATLFLRVLIRDENNTFPRPRVRPFDPRLLKEHLRRYFGITVLKGRADFELIPDVRFQLTNLTKRIAVGEPIFAFEMPSEAILLAWRRAT